MFRIPVVHDNSCQVCSDERVHTAACPRQKDTWNENTRPKAASQNSGQVD